MTIIKRVGRSVYAAVRKQLQREFVRFCVVGAIGFLVNFTSLSLFRDILHMPVILAVVLGGEVALISNFLFHNYWTYREHPQTKKISILFLQFHLAFWSGNGINALLTIFMILQLGWGEFVSLAIASFIVLFWNFGWTRFYIWRTKILEAED